MSRPWKCERGSAAIEFALVAPLLMTLIMGIVLYGSYFWTAHAVQQLANDAARAAVAGLDEAEQGSLARQAVAEEIGSYAALSGQAMTVAVQGGGDMITVRLVYNDAQAPYRLFSDLVPSPPADVRRTATVRIGGF